MKLPNKIGILLLAIWLIVWGLMNLVPRLSIEGSGMILAILAVAAGILILLDR